MARPLSMSDPQADPKSADFWRAQIKASQDKRQKYVEQWRGNIQRYLAKTLSETPTQDTIVVPLDYANTEQKKALLFFKVPEVQLTPKRPAFEQAVPVFQAVLNHYLGRHGVDARTMMHEALFDAICPSGLAVTMIGYEPTVDGKKPVQVGTQPDPNAAPSVLGLSVPELPVFAEVPNVIHEAYFWVRISPEKVLIPADFHGSDYDKAPWLGVEFEMDRAVALRKTWITADTPTGGDVEPKGLNTSETQDSESTTAKVKGTMLFYRMAHFDPGQPHPEAFGWFVLIDGREDFAVTPSPSPWQKFVPDETGKQRLIGLKGNPIHIKGARYVSDSAYPPSDVQMSKGGTDELSKFRSQMMQQRDRNIPMRWVDKNRLDKDTIDKIARGELQAIIQVDGNGNELMGVIQTAALPRENYETDRIVKQENAMIWRMGGNQKGVEDENTKTATEASIMQSATDVALAYEQDQWLDWFVRGAEKLGGLIQLFADDADYVEVVGEDGLPKLVQWDKTTVAGEFAYLAVPDTSIRQDATTKRKRALDLFNLLANEPHIDRGELVRDLLRDLGKSPKLFKSNLPEKGPEPMRLQLTIRSEDCNPAAPSFPVLKAIMEQSGLQIPSDSISTGLALQSKVDMGGMADPTLASMAKPGQLGPAVNDRNPGQAQEVAPLNKHQIDQTGALPGAGSMTPAVN